MAPQTEANKTATPGTMDITEQQRTLAGFIRFSMWTVILSILVLIFLALANA